MTNDTEAKIEMKGLEIRVIDNLCSSRLFFELRYSRAVPVFIFSIVLLIFTFFIWASYAQMDDVVKTQAILRPLENISSIRCLSSGEVYDKNYYHDDLVTEGDVLLRIDASSDILDLENSTRYFNQLKKDILDLTVLENTIIRNTNMALQDSDNAWLLCETYCSELARLLEQRDQVNLKIEREKNMPLNMRTDKKIADYESELMQSDQNIVSWRNREMVSVQDKIKNLVQTQQSIERRISDLERSIKNATVYAPISGRIDETLQINNGDFIMAGEELFRIVPDSGESLKAELMADSASIARIKIGQKVKLRFPGLPPSRYGQLEGSVSLIPADVKISGNTAVFIVEADIPHSYLLSSQDEKIFLRPGISAEGRIIIDHDTVLRMILRKLDFLQ